MGVPSGSKSNPSFASFDRVSQSRTMRKLRTKQRHYENRLLPLPLLLTRTLLVLYATLLRPWAVVVSTQFRSAAFQSAAFHHCGGLFSVEPSFTK